MNSALRKVICVVLVVGVTAVMSLAASATVHQVNIVGISFSPPTLTIAQGDTVRWTNNSGLFHTTTSGNPCTPNGIWNLDLPNGTSVTVPFTSLGIVPYFCIPHCGGGMTGQITVEAVPVKRSTWGAIKALYTER